MIAQELKRLLPSTADDGMATHIIEQHEATGLPLSDCLALVEKESGFRNVFGHDATSSIPERWKGSRVTWAKYRWYKLRRKSKGAQGVGPCQLTWPPLQNDADRMGGCHKPGPNMRLGFTHLKIQIERLGREKGAAAYNGTGPAAEAYGRDFVRKQEAWHKRVT
jgi:hypothetical protein